MKKTGVGILSGIVGILIGIVGAYNLTNKEAVEKQKKVDKFKGYYNILNQWLVNKNEGKSIEHYLLNLGYKTVAIYGMGEIGNRLCEELKNSGIELKYAIDKNSDNTVFGLNIVDLDCKLDEVDVIIVTAFFAFDEIREMIETKVDYPVISIEDIIFEL